MDPVAPVGSGTTPLVSDYRARGTRPLDPAMLAMLNPQPKTGTARVVPSGRRGVRGTVVIDGNPTWAALNAAMEGAFAGEEEPLQRPVTPQQARVAGATGVLNPAEAVDEMEVRLNVANRRFRVATLVKNIRITKGKLVVLGKRIEGYRMNLRGLRASLMAAKDGLRVAIMNRADPGTISRLTGNLQRLELAYGRLERVFNDATVEYQLLSSALIEFETELSILLA